MKLVIQIPCRDEAEHLPATLAELPRRLPGVDEIEWLVIDDGSTDGTAERARALGVRHLVRFERHEGLGRAFAAGLEAALAAGADLVVNTDADNQYRGDDVALLVAPLLRGEADLVVGDRRPGESPHFSWAKRRLQRLGSAAVRGLSGVPVADAASGFRAFTRESALRLRPRTSYSHTLETLLLAGELGLRVASVPVHTNPPRRPSRLFRSTAGYLGRSALTLIEVRLRRRPLAPLLGAAGLLLGAGGLWLAAAGPGGAGLCGAGLGGTGLGGAAGAPVLGLGLAAAGLAVLGFLAERAAARRRVVEGAELAARRARLAGPGPSVAAPVQPPGAVEDPERCAGPTPPPADTGAGWPQAGGPPTAPAAAAASG